MEGESSSRNYVFFFNILKIFKLHFVCLNFQIFVTSIPGWGYAPTWEMGLSMALYGDATTPHVLGCIKLITPYYLLNFKDSTTSGLIITFIF